MIWNRSETIGLANISCAHCHGYGLRAGYNGKEYPCNCVFRAVFRACYARFRNCVTREKEMSHVTLEFCRGKERNYFYSRKSEEYMADFCLIAQRVLDPLEHKIFRFHFLLGANWRLCCRQMDMDRGKFFRIVYAIEQKLGREFRELQPYGLYPLDEYFASWRRKEPVEIKPKVRSIERHPRVARLAPPLAKIA